MLFAMLVALMAAPLSAPAPQQSGDAVSARVDHLALHVSDLGASVDFYQQIFDLAELPAAVAGPRWLDLGRGVALHLIPGRSTPISNPRAAHLAISVDGLEAIASRLEARGIAWTDFEGRPGTVNAVRLDGVRQIFFRDPDGYWIEVNDRSRP